MWQNPYATNYNPMTGLRAPGQLNLNQFSSPGVITPPTNASPFPTQPDIPGVAQPLILPGQPANVLQPQTPQQMGSMVVEAFENFKKSIVWHEEDGDNMVLTVRIPTQILKSDQNFSFLFK